MKDDNSKRVPEKKVAEDTCKLCGDTFPVSGFQKAETCSQWCHHAIRNLPDPRDFSAMLALNIIAKLCLLTTTVNRGLHALDYIEEVSMDLSDEKAKR